MQVDEFYLHVAQRVYRIIPDGPENDPLDATFSARSSDNRWNRLGEPTLYIGGDPRVMAAEWARHIDVERLTPGIVRNARQRRIYEFSIAVDHVLDLRDPALCAALRIEDAPYCFLESKDRCQDLASWLRNDTAARALLVPSMALLDQRDRWVMVLFVDKLPTFPAPFITSIQAGVTLP